MTRIEPTPEQIKAVASPLRLRILALCEEDKLTNKQLAERLNRDPSTILHHMRLLENAGLIHALPVRQGPSGAYEKPYRSTRLASRLSFPLPASDDERLPMLEAFNEELADAGHRSIAQLTTFHLHLGEAEVADFIDQYLHFLGTWKEKDDERRTEGSPRYGGIIVIHRLAESHPTETRR